MFNPSGKIFGLHCWHLIDSPANTKILMSCKRTKYSNHHLCVLWWGLGRRGRCSALVCRCGCGCGAYVGCRQTTSWGWVESDPAAQTLLQRTGALHLPFGLAELSRRCLAKSLGILFHSNDAGRAISYLTFRAQDPKMSLEALVCTLDLQE